MVSDIQEVLLKPDQYCPFKILERKLKNPFDYNCSGIIKSLELAEGILGGYVEDPTNGATHFFNPTKASPKWAEKLDYIGEIGESQHLFYRDPNINGSKYANK